MAGVRFEWDPNKAVSNWQKHQVSFEEAASAFYDENGRIIADPDHFDEEERFLLLGLSSALQILVVSHCYRAASEVIRIISARRAEKTERDQYGAN